MPGRLCSGSICIHHGASKQCSEITQRCWGSLIRPMLLEAHEELTGIIQMQPLSCACASMVAANRVSKPRWVCMPFVSYESVPVYNLPDLSSGFCVSSRPPMDLWTHASLQTGTLLNLDTTKQAQKCERRLAASFHTLTRCGLAGLMPLLPANGCPLCLECL